MSNETLCHAEEVAAGQRFEFGKNWQLYLKSLTPERISLAEDLADLADRQSAHAGDEGQDEAELMALLDSVMPTLRSWAAPLASARRAA